MSKDYFLVDGYNVINSWQEFNEIREENLEHARELLVHYVAEYVAFHGLKEILVFDAMEVKGNCEIEKRVGLEIVFTAEGETADTWIERRTYELIKAKEKVFVVTSDYAQQNNILTSGGYRVSSREFKENYKRTKKLITEKIDEKTSSLGRNEISARLKGDILTHFEEFRRK